MTYASLLLFALAAFLLAGVYSLVRQGLKAGALVALALAALAALGGVMWL
ncbi:hypothetical protein [Actinomadura macrotermitis]|uniref:Uncharacterized protein n=1 Tax=Actinomadura macrotermitis TaxID=2585200 RepID=A0A7K0BM78_9ACTN|nr:hypothetical protein [Actinomadura macrotermitis]MQY02289.1 hypothetical protein [Actinomadura macrotermitis]